MDFLLQSTQKPQWDTAFSQISSNNMVQSMEKRSHPLSFNCLSNIADRHWMTNDYLELKVLVGPRVHGCAVLNSLCSDSWQRKKLTWQKPALHKKKQSITGTQS